MRYAVLIGVTEYAHAPNLRFCHADVDLLAETLEKAADFSSQHVVRIKLDLQNSSSPEEILAKIKEVVDRTEASDTIHFFFSGHGDLVDREQYLYLPQSTRKDPQRTAIPLRDVTNLLRKEDRYCFRILDACHAGSYAKDGDGQPLDSSGFVRALAKEPDVGWVTYASCRPDQESYEDPSLGHGVYTYKFCEAIRSFDVDTDIRCELLNAKVVDLVTEHVDTTKRIQTPVFQGSIDGKTIFARRREPPAETPAVDSPKPSQAPSESEILTRLDAIRKMATTDPDAQQTGFEELQTVLQAAMNDRASRLKTFGLKQQTVSSYRADSLPDALKPQIVRYIEKEGLKPIHTVRSDKTGTGLLGMTLWPYATSTRRYRVEQAASMPDSVLCIRIPGDGIVKASSIWTYLCPLRTRTLLFTGFIVSDGEDDDDDDAIVNSWVEPLSADDPKKQLEAAVNQIVERFNDAFCKDVRDHVSYLEREIAL